MVNARSILWYMVFSGFAVDYMIRISININIVDMVIDVDESIKSTGSNVTVNLRSIIFVNL